MYADLHHFVRGGRDRRARRRPGARRRYRVAAGSALTAVLLSTATTAAAAPAAGSNAPHYRQVAVLRLPAANGPLGGSDIVFADPSTHRVYLANWSHAEVAVWDTRTNRFLGAMSGGFTGAAGVPQSFAGIGPKGVLVDDLGQIWAGNGNGTLEVGSVRTLRETGSVPTGASGDVDELGYDPEDKIIIAGDPDADPPQVTLVAARQHRVLGHVVIPGALPGSIEQPKWDPRIERFLVSVTATATHPDGAVAVIDPVERTVDRVLPLTQPCGPAGMAIGPGRDVLLGCGSAPSVIINDRTGRVEATFAQACCADEVWYSRAAGRYYVAEPGNVSGATPDPVVLVANAHRRTFVTNIAIRDGLGQDDPAFHAVTTAAGGRRIYVPLSDGVHVYALRHRTL